MTVIVAVLEGSTLLLLLRSFLRGFFAKLTCKASWQLAGVLQAADCHAKVFVQPT
jgi:hypothetical protein